MSSKEILNKARMILWKKARIKSHNDDFGKSPKDLKINMDELSELDISFRREDFKIKAFYRNGRKCFYYKASLKDMDTWLKAATELMNETDFDEEDLSF